MFVRTIEPAFYDTDALGHVNNTRLPAWFELARNDLFRLFTPDLDPRQEGKLTNVGHAVLVQFDHQAKRAVPIEGALREALEAHLQPFEEPVSA